MQSLSVASTFFTKHPSLRATLFTKEGEGYMNPNSLESLYKLHQKTNLLEHLLNMANGGCFVKLNF